MRIKNSIKNISFAIIGQFIGILVSFVSRMVFIKVLGAEYLGINGLFTNILSILAVAELGIGPAIVYSLYKPIALKDIPKIKALMKIYKQSYIAIGSIVGILGVLLVPFLGVFTKEIVDVENIKLIYLLFVANSTITYFYSYKRSLIIADQKRYIATFYRYTFFCILNILQIVVLLVTKNYIIFMIMQVLINFTESIFISITANRMYPYIMDKNVDPLDRSTKEEIVKNIKAMIYHKIGSKIVLSTDNIIISSFVGIITVGIYSNYLLIVNALNAVIGQVFEAITASVGNLGAVESKEKTKFIFDVMCMVGFWIFSFSSISLLCLFNPFITLWIGDKYLFKPILVLLIVSNFFLSGLRKPVLTFREALGLYWYDRYKPIFEAIVNLIVSIILVNYIGVAGVFIGTIISTLSTCIWIEPYVLYKYGFKESVRSYYLKISQYTLIAIGIGIATVFISSIFKTPTWINFIGRIVVSISIPNTMLFIIFHKSKEFKYLVSIFKAVVNSKA